jgi:hypothetical protein
MISALMVLLGASCSSSGTAEGLARSAAMSAKPPAGCARREPRINRNPWPATLHELAPPGASAIRLCRYGTLPRLALERARLVTDSGLVKKLVDDFNRLPPPPVPTFNCPADFGSRIDALLAYPAGQRVTVSVDLTGCAPATNGNLDRLAAGFGTPRAYGPQLLAELGRLSGYRGIVY